MLQCYRSLQLLSKSFCEISKIFQMDFLGKNIQNNDWLGHLFALWRKLFSSRATCDKLKPSTKPAELLIMQEYKCDKRDRES